jgi:hypothetical protein
MASTSNPDELTGTFATVEDFLALIGAIGPGAESDEPTEPTEEDWIECDVCEHTHAVDECAHKGECYEQCAQDGCGRRLGYVSCMGFKDFENHPDREPGYCEECYKWYCPKHAGKQCDECYQKESEEKPVECACCA